MAILITGSTGFIGSYVTTQLLEHHHGRLSLLVRAKSHDEAKRRLWRSLQLHMDFSRFAERFERIEVYLGDLTSPRLGLEPDRWSALVRSTDSIVHCAASLNRKSPTACFNINLRGTLSMIKLGQDAHEHHGLRRFSNVSTVAVAGRRMHEVVQEDEAVDWSRGDYDPYARTKKFSEYMTRELLVDVPITTFRPSVVLGDSRFSETTQFDMVHAFVGLARMRLLPLHPDCRLDIVPADYVGRAIASLHQHDHLDHDIYHLSAGGDSLSYRQLVSDLRSAGHRHSVRFAPRLAGPFGHLLGPLMSLPRSWKTTRAASLLKVFWPYLTNDTVFDNRRVVKVLGEKPAPFSRYAYSLMQFALENGFRYPYAPFPTDPSG